MNRFFAFVITLVTSRGTIVKKTGSTVRRTFIDSGVQEVTSSDRFPSPSDQVVATGGYCELCNTWKEELYPKGSIVTPRIYKTVVTCVTRSFVNILS